MGSIRHLYIFLASLMLIQACSTVKETYDPKDLSYLYNPSRNVIHPNYRVFHLDDSISELSVKLSSGDLFFSEANPDGVPKASMVIIYRLYNISQGVISVDTGLFNMSIEQIKGKREYTYNIPMDAARGSKYEAEIVLRDMIRNIRIQSFIPFDKTSDLNAYNFKVRGHFNQMEVYTPILKREQFVNLLYPRKRPDSLYIYYYDPFKDIPIAPSMLMPETEMDLEPDDFIVLPYSDTLPLMLPNEGIYLCCVDSNIIDGYTFMNFGFDFPNMSDPLPMIEPLIYLSNETALEEMRAHPRPKVMLDEFWLNTTSNIERSRELIRIYYSRVLYANYFFSSFKEGWRTDRGMIYLLYGPPDKVYKTADGEQWGYRLRIVKNGWGIRYRVEDDFLFFNFKRRENQFSENEYTLLRSESITTYWEQAVRSWLSGIVFRLDNPTDI